MTRSEYLRQRNRRIFRWSLVAAAVAHAVLFLTWRWSDSPGDPARTGPRPTLFGELEAPSVVQVVFGPTSIRKGNAWHAEPEEHTLSAELMTRLPGECVSFQWLGGDVLRASVDLTVDSAGYAHVRSVSASTGHECGDAVASRSAGALRYHWLPDARFPAPVEVRQPVIISTVFGL